MFSKIDSEILRTEEDVFVMLDNLLEKREREWWDKFYSDKNKPIPFFKNAPDENLVSYVEKGLFKGGKILDIGCGYGRNSFYLAKQGFDAYVIDFSMTSIEWGKQIADEEGIKVNLLCESMFNFKAEQESFDYIYDSGCMHHIKPHRRTQYLKAILKYLKPQGYFGMTCFNLKGGANVSDYDVYKDYSMHGGLGFSEYKLKSILEPYFEIIEFREMKESTGDSVFGKSFLWTILMKKK